MEREKSNYPSFTSIIYWLDYTVLVYFAVIGIVERLNSSGGQ